MRWAHPCGRDELGCGASRSAILTVTLVRTKSRDNCGSNHSRLYRGSVRTGPYLRAGRCAAIEADWRHARGEVVRETFDRFEMVRPAWDEWVRQGDVE